MRVFELAKDLEMESKALIARLKEMGVAVKSHMSGVGAETVERLRSEIQKAPPKAAPSGKAKPASRKKPSIGR